MQNKDPTINEPSQLQLTLGFTPQKRSQKSSLAQESSQASIRETTNQSREFVLFSPKLRTEKGFPRLKPINVTKRVQKKLLIQQFAEQLVFGTNSSQSERQELPSILPNYHSKEVYSSKLFQSQQDEDEIQDQMTRTARFNTQDFQNSEQESFQSQTNHNTEYNHYNQSEETPSKKHQKKRNREKSLNQQLGILRKSYENNTQVRGLSPFFPKKKVKEDNYDMESSRRNSLQITLNDDTNFKQYYSQEKNKGKQKEERKKDRRFFTENNTPQDSKRNSIILPQIKNPKNDNLQSDRHHFLKDKNRYTSINNHLQTYQQSNFIQKRNSVQPILNSLDFNYPTQKFTALHKQKNEIQIQEQHFQVSDATKEQLNKQIPPYIQKINIKLNKQTLFKINNLKEKPPSTTITLKRPQFEIKFGEKLSIKPLTSDAITQQKRFENQSPKILSSNRSQPILINQENQINGSKPLFRVMSKQVIKNEIIQEEEFEHESRLSSRLSQRR